MPRPRTAEGAPDRPGWEAVVESIGPEVRVLRDRRELSLQQLAQRADVSAAAIHKVERGDMVPTVTTLLKIAGALGVSIGHFLGTELPDPPKAVRSRALQAEPSAPGSTSLSGPRGRFRSTGAVSRLAPGDARRGRRAPGEALVVVVHGSLAVRVRAQEHTLVAGESLHFPTDVEHRWSNPGPGLAQAVWFTVAD